MSVRIGGNTFSYQWTTPILGALQALSALGLNDFDVIMPPRWLTRDGTVDDELVPLRRAIDDEGLRIESLNPPALDFNLGSLVDDVRLASVAMYERTLRRASRLGAGGVVVVPGRVSGLLPPATADTLASLGESFARLVPLARELGLRLHVETHPQTAMPTAEATLRFVEAYPADTVGVAYDVANAEYIGEDQPAAIRTLGARLTQLHLSDATRTAWRHDPLGSGTVPVAACLAAADAVGFGGVAVLELIAPDPLPAFQASLAHLRHCQQETHP